MQREAIQIATLFEKPQSSARSPLSPIPVPNENASAAAAISVDPKSALGKEVITRPATRTRRRREIMDSSDESSPSSSSSGPSLRFLVSRKDNNFNESEVTEISSPGSFAGTQEEDEPRPIGFKWILGERLRKRKNTFLALNQTTGELVVAKQYTFDTTRRPGRPSQPSIKREVALMQRVAHPHLAQIIGCDVDVESSFFVLSEIVVGQTVRDKRNAGPLSEPDVRRITSQVLDALVYLHSQDIVHGNLKSSKVYFGADGVCKITGLGCSTACKRDHSRAVPKAIWWTAPEIIRTQYQEWGPPADVWSVGCLLLEMLSGKRPWFDTEAVAVMFKLYHQTARPAVPPDVTLDSGALDLLDKCLALQPQDRMTATQLRQAPFLQVVD
ncbi:Kinase-like protein [Mycena indigotica]|uniref:Kinase-like protein n=1 Tax=Mycena indigotica TaxID=2126181 RepID=A0A8H6T7S1_9AGAR|nr:Kinase-like protein [Mycena indigotica]KAF7312623.1 Kinase-like protein [Mycena indigotica]